MSSIDSLIQQGVSGFDQLLSGASAAATQGAAQGAQGAIPGLVAQASQAVQAELPAIASAGGQAATQALQASLPAVQQAVAPAVQQVGHDFGQSAVQGAKEESVAPVAVVVTGAALLALVVGIAAVKSRKPEVRAAEQPFYRDPNPTREQKLPFVGVLTARKSVTPEFAAAVDAQVARKRGLSSASASADVPWADRPAYKAGYMVYPGAVAGDGGPTVSWRIYLNGRRLHSYPDFTSPDAAWDHIDDELAARRS